MHHLVRRSSATLIATFGILALATLGAPSAGAAVDAEEWTAQFCGAWATFYEGAAAGVATLAGVDPQTDPPAATRKKLVGFGATGVKETKRFAKEMRGIGEPDVPNGAEIVETLANGIDQTKKNVIALKKRAKQLEPKRAGFRDAADEQLQQVRAGMFLAAYQSALNRAQQLDADGTIDSHIRTRKECIPLLAGSAPGS